MIIKLKFTITIVTFFCFKLFAIEENYKELEAIEEELKYNKEILLELKKIENELSSDIRKVDLDLKKKQIYDRKRV